MPTLPLSATGNLGSSSGCTGQARKGKGKKKAKTTHSPPSGNTNIDSVASCLDSRHRKEKKPNLTGSEVPRLAGGRRPTAGKPLALAFRAREALTPWAHSPQDTSCRGRSRIWRPESTAVCVGAGGGVCTGKRRRKRPTPTHRQQDSARQGPCHVPACSDSQTFRCPLTSSSLAMRTPDPQAPPVQTA